MVIHTVMLKQSIITNIMSTTNIMGTTSMRKYAKKRMITIATCRCRVFWKLPKQRELLR